MYLLTVLCELLIVALNLLIFSEMTVFMTNDFGMKLVIGAVGGIIMLSYGVCVGMGLLSKTFAILMCVLIPTFVLIIILSKYKDFRFIATFCFVESVMTILTFLAYCVTFIPGNKKLLNIISIVGLCVLIIALYFGCRKYFVHYRNLMSDLNKGWKTMSVSMLLIYALLIFMSLYPEPLSQRPEYLATYGAISVTVISFFAVFIVTLHQKRTLLQLNDSLVAEKSWRMIAHNDTLTGMENRTAFVETVNEIQQFSDDNKNVFALMLDINNFKKINDTLGHHVGDDALINASYIVRNCFEGDGFRSFRIGGDEFAVIAEGVEEEIIAEKVQSLKKVYVFEDLKCGFSIGFSKVDFSIESAVEKAFIIADKAMYEEKARIKREEALMAV